MASTATETATPSSNNNNNVTKNMAPLKMKKKPSDSGNVLSKQNRITFTAGLIAGAVSRTMTAPLDRIKLLMQEGRIQQHTMPHPTVHRLARDHHRPRYGLLKIVTIVLREGGVKAFWRGNGVNCLKAGPEFATMFLVRQLIVDRFGTGKPGLMENFVLSASAGGTAQVIIYPMELVKARMAVSAAGEYRGVADCITQCYRRGGFFEFYKGMGANLAGIVPNRGAEMGLFFTLEQSWTTYFNERPPLFVLTGMGMFASMTAQVLTYPLNLIRLKMQIQGTNGRPSHSGSVPCARHIYHTEGLHGFFRGLLPNMLKGVPASTLMYVTFREAKVMMENWCGEEE
eukprot:PhM_4_TR6820/c0_g1_i1/m.67758/K14684/SLC25A23S; solute carrier family 25 (mitochondrial phosphate transporter), member 23/24/25/41